jgi:hypothetical protein
MIYEIYCHTYDGKMKIEKTHFINDLSAEKALEAAEKMHGFNSTGNGRIIFTKMYQSSTNYEDRDNCYAQYDRDGYNCINVEPAYFDHKAAQRRNGVNKDNSGFEVRHASNSI